MHKLIDGVHKFQDSVFSAQAELFWRLAQSGQKPDALFITCSDSRVNPNQVTMTQPGELFILRNAGNLIPPHGDRGGGEEATVEYAVAELGVRDIIVCGHTHCGAVQALIQPDPDRVRQKMPAVWEWLRHADATRRIVRENYQGLTDEQRLNVAIQANVLVQVEHLRTHPAVAAALARGDLNLHGWVFKIETGEVFAFDPGQGQFLPLADQPIPAVRPLRLIPAQSI
jgi:carbonic anhydrase